MGCIVSPCIAAHLLCTCALVNRLESLSLPRLSGMSDRPFIYALAVYWAYAWIEVSFHLNVGLKSHKNGGDILT